MERNYRIPTVDIVLMNPPFTRIHRMDASYKRFLLRISMSDGTTKYSGGQLGLHGYFILHMDKFLNQGGIISAVLPASLIYTSYGEGVRNYLLNKYKIDYIITSDVNVTFSEQSDFKEILLIVTKTQ